MVNLLLLNLLSSAYVLVCCTLLSFHNATKSGMTALMMAANIKTDRNVFSIFKV